MKISKQTLAILRNLASINQTFIHSDGTLKSTTVNKNLVAHATVPEELPAFQVYDLKEFISVVEMFDSPDIEFLEKEALISSGRSKVRYAYCSIDLINPVPPKNVKFPEPVITCEISKEDLAQVQKASSVLGLADIVIRVEDGKVLLGVEAAQAEGNRNSFVTEINGTSTVSKARVVLKPDAIKFIPANYKVRIHQKIVEFSTVLSDDGSFAISYWAGPDASSTFE